MEQRTYTIKYAGEERQFSDIESTISSLAGAVLHCMTNDKLSPNEDVIAIMDDDIDDHAPNTLTLVISNNTIVIEGISKAEWKKYGPPEAVEQNITLN